MNSIRYYLMNALTILLFCSSNPEYVSAGENKRPEVIVENFQDGLINFMKASKTLDKKQSYLKLEPILDVSFHFQLMIQIAVGSYWVAADQALRLKLIKSFKRLSISTLATLFNGYNGEFFEYKENAPGPHQTTLIVTDLVKSDKTRIEISYVTRKFANSWRIIDVILGGGISELKVKQSEYRQILKTKGISGLISLLDNKSDELMNTTTIK